MKNIEDILGYQGKIIGSSKSIYRHEHQEDLIVYNANICTAEDGKLWYGDLNVTLEEDKIKKLAKELNKIIYVLYESSARFENEADPVFEDFVYFTDGKDRTEWKSKEYKRVDEAIKLVEDLSEFGYQTIIKFDDIDQFKYSKKTDKDKSPIIKFYDFIMDKLNIKLEPGEVFNINLVYITEETDILLTYLVKEWSKIVAPNQHTVKTAQSVSMYMCDIGPYSFRSKQKFHTSNNKIYIKQGDLKIKRS